MSYMHPYNPTHVMGAADAHFCPDCPTQSVFDPPVTLYENYYHPQLVNVIQQVEVVKQHHCCPVYHKSYVFTEKDVMVRGGKRATISSKSSAKKRSKKR
ncbi:hypothetical protein [Paenibacillus sp. GCM10023250]|uniref:hypothetical protein n=1 Tax=Paenibacillus sp. GCM10023250 TaxID=3252648 RepID=UPI003618CDAE